MYKANFLKIVLSNPVSILVEIPITFILFGVFHPRQFCFLNQLIINDAGSDYHLIFGGYFSDYSYLDAAELYDWKTGQQCKLPPLPLGVASSSAIAMDGTLAYCGGDSDYWEVLHCYKLEKNTRTWVQVSSL